MRNRRERMTFENLGIDKSILEVLKKAGFEKPTPIQKECIPAVKKGLDVIAQSETGSGKTLAFAIPIMEMIEPGKGIQALVVTPTRELANQIYREFLKLTVYKMAMIRPIYGGTPLEPQIVGLRNADVVIATPGRVLDHVNRRTINLAHVRFLVIDEADRMLDMGFIDDVERIINLTPRTRQTMLFSATIPDPVFRISKRYMKNPVKISTQRYVRADLLNQFYYDVMDNEKFSLLVHLIKKENPKLAMIFCGRRTTADAVYKNLVSNGVNAKVIHGGLEQEKRERIMSEMHSGGINVLVATDVASRGLDIKGVTHIFNYDVPDKSDDYTHRIGRTARAGKSGKAITLLAPADHQNFRRILQMNPGLSVQKGEKEPYEKVPFDARSGRERGGGGYGRGGFRGRGPPRRGPPHRRW
jgi:ATP-dependent RNA helicase DeaD